MYEVPNNKVLNLMQNNRKSEKNSESAPVSLPGFVHLQQDLRVL